MTSNILIRPAEAGDAEALADFIHRLAAHHGIPATVDAARLREHGFGRTPCFDAIVAAEGDRLVGYALWTFAYNPYFGRRVLQLNNLFVVDERRRGGVGRALVRAVALRAAAEDYDRIRVGTKHGNAPAIDVYRGLGFQESLPTFFVDHDQFRRLDSPTAEPAPRLDRASDSGHSL